ncbi:MAG: hypothetical protein GY722_23045 [bacterium]|nr:hypothetical protein [bacterium]
MRFDRRALLGFFAVGIGAAVIGAWMAVEGPTNGVRPFTSPAVTRVVGLIAVGGSMVRIVPGLFMLPRLRLAAVESDGARVTVRAAVGPTRVIEWAVIERVILRPYAVDLRLRTGRRLRVYGQVVEAPGGSAVAEVAGFFARGIARRRDPSSRRESSNRRG